MGHLQATGSEISDDDRSERTVIGGVEGISPDAFDAQIIYTALGHLHRPQRVSGARDCTLFGSSYSYVFLRKRLQKQCGDGGV